MEASIPGATFLFFQLVIGKGTALACNLERPTCFYSSWRGSKTCSLRVRIHRDKKPVSGPYQQTWADGLKNCLADIQAQAGVWAQGRCNGGWSQSSGSATFSSATQVSWPGSVTAVSQSFSLSIDVHLGGTLGAIVGSKEHSLKLH